MNELLLFINLQKKLFHNHRETWKQHSRLKVIVVSTFASIFFLTLFLFFYGGFLFFYDYIPRDFFYMIMDYMFCLFYFSLFTMLLFSACIIAFSVFFHAEETRYLMTCPLTFSSVFFYKFYETFLVSSWAVFFLGIPVCFAYGIQQRVSLEFYPLLIAIFIPFVTIAALIGTLFAFVMMLYLKKYIRWILLFIGALLITGIVLLVISITNLKNEVPTMTASWLFGLLDYFKFAHHPLAPSTWASQAMTALTQQEYKTFAFYLITLYSTMFFLCAVAYLLTNYRYHQAWNIAHSTKEQKSQWTLAWVHNFLRILFFFKNKDRTFLEKDIKIFVRDPLQWSQFAILLGLLLLYILNLRTLHYDQRPLFWQHFVTTLNLGATAMILCTFASRFIFPLLSLEGKRFWMLGIMPISRRNVVISKFLFSVTMLFGCSEILIFLSCYMLRLPWGLTMLHSISILEITLGVSGLAVGLGALYPNFREDSPAKIVSGFGGTLNLILGLAYVLTMVLIQNVPSYLILKETITLPTLYLCLLIGLAVTTVTCFIPLAMGIRHLESLEM